MPVIDIPNIKAKKTISNFNNKATMKVVAQVKQTEQNIIFFNFGMVVIKKV